MSALRRVVLCLYAACLAAGLSTPSAAAHPQDGPHADLRIQVEDFSVRFFVGVNLVLLDQALAAPREALGAVSEFEESTLLDAFREFAETEIVVEINDQPVQPRFEQLAFFRDPEDGLIAIFPRMGARALMRLAAKLDYTVPAGGSALVDSIAVTWPVYPPDELALQMERVAPGRDAPPMFFEGIIVAGGRVSPLIFSETRPTVTWTRDDGNADDPLASLPPPSLAIGGTPVPTLSLVLGVAAAVSCIAAAAALGATATRRAPVRVGWAVLALALTAGSGFAYARATTDAADSVLTTADARIVTDALHTAMYRAFDYTDEEEVYDRLALAVGGDLLPTVYEEVRASLVQAEQDMKLGVVTGLEHIETEITETARTPDAANAPPGFTARRTWRVEGTVFHFGHSHTRLNEYQADYRITHTDLGWRITSQSLLSQQRLETEYDSEPMPSRDEIQRMLDSMGVPDF